MIEMVEEDDRSGETIPADKPVFVEENIPRTNWQAWAGILILICLGLVAVTAGNMLTLLLAWVALDIIEVAILLAQVEQSKSRERIILAFSARMAGIATLLLTGIILWSQGASFTFENISPAISLYLILAAVLRLGVLPLHLPISQKLPLSRGLGTALRLIPAASSYILLVRVAFVGVTGSITPYLLGLVALSGLYAAYNWMRAKDELNGRPYWLLGTASFAVASAILNRPSACIAWSIASLLSGGLIFSMSLRHRNLIPIVVLGLVNLSALPFSPTWQATALYQYSASATSTITQATYYLLIFFFLLTHSLLLAGFFHHALKGIFPAGERTSELVERWVWFLYPIGLIFIAITHLLFGWWLQPNLNEIPFSGWIMGVLALIIAGIIVYITWRYPRTFPRIGQSVTTTSRNYFFPLGWLYRILWRLFRSISRLFALFSLILEGEGGILWALVLFALIFVFLQR
jgi:hypothetical protein